MSHLSNRLRYFWLAYLVVLVVYVILPAKSAWSQEVTAVIMGTITDPSGSAIAGAVITATDTERGSSFSTKSNSEGTYSLPRIPIGTYALRVEATGFRKEFVPTFTLVLNQTARYDFKMEIGKVTEQVEVSSAAPLLQTQTTEISTIIDAETNVALPLASRNYVQLALLAPGAVTPNREAIATSQRIDNAGQPYINGNREQDNNFLLDGMDNNQVSDNLVAYTPSPDAIEEFNLITQNASAEFGNFQGGIISVSIKSGTNHFHGALWEFFRNDKLNANNYFNNFFGLPKLGYRWNMFGGTVGGPIIKNKLFFFADYQGQRFDVYSNSTFSALTQNERNGDFGQLCTDPAISPGPGTFDANGNCINTANTAGTQVIDPFTGGNIPYNNLATYISNNSDPTLTAYYNTGAGKVFNGLVNSQYYPSVSSLMGTSIFNNFIYSTKSPLNVDQGDFKLDYNYSEKDRFFARFSREDQVNNPVNSLLIEPVNEGTATMYNGVLSWTHGFTPNLLNDFRFGVNWVQLLNNATATPGLGDLGVAIGIANGNSGGEGLPWVNTYGPSTYVGGAGIIQDWSNTVLQLGDTLDWTHGRHTTHLGFQFIRERMDDFYAGNNGLMGFFNMTGTYSGAGDTDFYLGMVNSEGQYFSNGGASNPEVWGQRSSVIGSFIQDDWRTTSNLTLNLGLRFQAHTPWIEEAGREVNYSPFTGQPLYPAGSTLPTTPAFPGLPPQADSEKALYNGYYGIGDWQPRIGIAYTPPFLHGKTVIRTAVTFSDYLEGTGNNLRPTLNIPFNLQLQFTNVPPFGTTGYNPALLQLPNGIPSPSTCSGSSSTCNAFNGAVLNVWSPNVRPAMTQQWNLAVQQQIFRDTTVQVAYVGQHGSHLMVPVNMLQGDLLSNGNVVNSPYLAGNPDLLGESGCTPSATVFCQPSPVAKGTYSIGNMSYNALQAVLQKRMGHGVEGQVSYTYSHCLTSNIGYYGDGAQASPQSAYWQNTFDSKAEWGSCYFDLASNLTAYAIYEIPIGRDRLIGGTMNPWLNGAIGGWRLSPIFSYHGGFPLTIAGNDYSGTNSFGSRANCSGPPEYLKQFIPDVGLQWFSMTPYSNPVVGAFGNCSVSTVRGPGLNRWDVSIQKEFPIREQMRFEFRAEFLNVFNHPTFEAPSTYCGGTETPVGGPAVPCVSGLGLISASEGERKIQFALKLYF
jgi:hypothetical protein